MRMSAPEPRNLAEALATRASSSPHALWTTKGEFEFADLAKTGRLSQASTDFLGKNIVLAADQLATIAAMIELDGLVRRIVLCPPDLSIDLLDHVILESEADVVVSDRADVDERSVRVPLVGCGLAAPSSAESPSRPHVSEWVLFTSGTSGPPKLVSHTLAGLTGAISRVGAQDASIWGTFYDIRRFGGLQILLRALVGGGSLVLADETESGAAYLQRLASHGATHVTGTPSRWRAMLMSGAARAIAPVYVRLSGEIADQSILDALAAQYPSARIVHAFASTEAGVAFEVHDGRAGFPAALLADAGPVDLKIVDGSLCIRSARCASRYINVADRELRDADGFVDTGDIVEIRGDRCCFLGRKGGVINVGGLKIHPEEIESVINGCAGVRASLVAARKNPILGSIVVADVVLENGAASSADKSAAVDAIQKHCRELLPAHKIPVSIRIVGSLETSSAGKLARHG
jgi:acyl-coenzyme A synthetase/AMP-(fatty) acid ligase